MGKATSLVELILKKWGDDIAGAAKELEEKVGFPESVANRIATGELPMDPESVARRADEQGYGDVVYHGSTDPNILEVSAGKFGSRNEDAAETGMWMSESPYVANGYSGGYADNGAVYPLRYKSDEPAYINAQGAHWARLNPDSPVMMNVSNRKIDEMWDPETGEDIPEMWDTLKQERVESTLDEVDPNLEYTDHNYHRDTNNTAEMAKDNWNDSAIFFHVRDPGPYSQIDAHTHKDWDMPINKARFEGGRPTDVATNHVVLKPYDIRSPNAAFDPQYTGTNIMGNADPRLLAGIAGTTAAGLAAPMIKDSGMISAPRSETLFDLTIGARDLERRLEGSPASLLFPSGLVEYLETVNRREEDPNAMTRGMALLDVLPF